MSATGTTRTITLALLPFLVCGIGSATVAASQDAPGGNASDGREIFVRYGCHSCHGYEGQGAGTTGPRLAPDPIAFRALSVYVRRPAGNMPPYTAEVVTDRELADIYAFLESIPDPPSVDGILTD